MDDMVERFGLTEVWPLASHLAEEMTARGWKATDVATRMPGDYAKNIVIVNLILAVQDDKMILDRELLQNLASAFGVSTDFFANLRETWLRWPLARQPFDCPEELLNGLLIPANDAALGSKGE